jgi:uncharacterized FlgJ-related protein
MKPKDFINKVAPLIVESWKRKNVILPCVAISMASLESNYNDGTVAQQTNNLFVYWQMDGLLQNAFCETVYIIVNTMIGLKV